MKRHYMAAAALGLASLALPRDALAQFGGALSGGSKNSTPVDRNQPVAFTADSFGYDRDNGIVTATGHVEAWQNDHVLRADKVTFDRNTNVAAASGNVVLVEPDGQVLFADYAELTQGMRQAVLKGMRAILAENGKLAANGARRTDGEINEMTKAVYTTCNLCKTDPSLPPLWQLRALTATQDLENKTIEYRNTWVDFLGVPVAWFPYLSTPDPSVRRQSGFLVPTIGSATHVGVFYEQPYFWAIDENQDATLTPLVSTQTGAGVNGQYRRRFNNGTLTTEFGGAFDQGDPNAFIFAKGQFNYDDTWRYGFNGNYATSANYLRDYRVQDYSSVLTSNAYIEGFGVGSYTKLDAIGYEGLATSIVQSRVPFVLPRYEFSYFSEPDSGGGRFRFDTTDFNVIRSNGTDTQRAAAALDYQRPFQGALGEQYNVQFHVDSAAYNATGVNLQPSYGTPSSVDTAHAQPSAAAMMRFPFTRYDGTTGTQVIEPIVQLVAAPNAPSFLGGRIPNEDSLDFEFSDANLFAINRFGGYDRFEGGLRANVGVHGSWVVDGVNVDALVGQSYKNHTDNSLPPLSGLNRRVSDVVSRVAVTPASWLDIQARSRVDPFAGDLRFADVLASAGKPIFRPTLGYLYSATNPYYLYDQSPLTQLPGGYPSSYFSPRNEITVGASSQYGEYKVSGYVRRDLHQSRFDAVGLRGTYEDECFIFDVNFYKRYTSINNDSGGTTVLFTITLKTVGQFGFHG